jgi:general secretion pathway protein H
MLNNARRMAVVQGQTTRVEFEMADANLRVGDDDGLPSTQASLWRTKNLELWYASSTQSSQRVDERLVISFFPEGGSTGGELIFRQNDRERVVEIDPFSGRVSIHDEP